MGTMEDIQEWKHKAGSYDTLKEEYDRLIEKFREIRGIADTVIIASGVPIVQESHKRGQVKTIASALYERMKEDDNFHVTSKKIEKLYPDINKSNVNYLLKKISVMENVKSTKDGIFIRLFYNKPSQAPEFKIGKVSHMG